MTSAPRRRILFLCTGNACRSQMAEAILRHVGGERFEALSAGSHPAGFIHLLAEVALGRMNVPLEGQSSKSWDEFVGTPIDAVITLCDAAASEPCPVFPGSPIRAHWSTPDPTQQPGTDEQRTAFAMLIANRLQTKIEALIALDWNAPRDELQKRLRFLGEI